MKRTTKRRLGMAGLVVAGMMFVMILGSFRISIALDGSDSDSASWIPDTPRYPAVVRISSGIFWVQVPTNFWEKHHLWTLERDDEWPVPLTNFRPWISWRPFVDRRTAFFFLTIPLWIPTLLIAIPSFLLWRRNRKLPEGHCNCGYNLTGNMSGVCPECGRKLLANGDGKNSADEDVVK